MSDKKKNYSLDGFIARTNQLIAESKLSECTLALIDNNGYPSASTVSPLQNDGIFQFFFSTNTISNKVNRINLCNKASVCLAFDNNNITLVGNVEVIHDVETKASLWQDWFWAHYPEGPTDSNYCILKFTTERVSLWVDRQTSEFIIDDVLKPDSRCGGFCSRCPYSNGPCTASCFESMGKPFWGTCEVAQCCQEKGLIHCGQCDEMPCAKLYEYSYGDGEESDTPKGSRPEMLRRWAQHEGSNTFFQCAVVRESISDKSLLESIATYKTSERIVEMPDDLHPVWHIEGYNFSENKLMSVVDCLKDTIEPTYYAHAFSQSLNKLIVILKGKVFVLKGKRDESWETMIAYGESLGIERKWTENIPKSI